MIMSTSLDPQIENVLKLIEKADYPEFWQLTPQQARAQFEKTMPVLDAKPAALHAIENHTIPGTGQNSITIRCYTPIETDEPLPVTVWLHGGGFVVGSLDSYDAVCRQLAKRAGCLVVAVDYRLAPEHRFPAAVEDCFAALRWVAENAAELGGDPARIAIAGDSAGGNLAAVSTILARDAGLAQPIFQLLIYPCTAPLPDSASHHRYAEGHLLTRRTILWFFEQYTANPEDIDDFRYAPLVTDNLSRLPPTLLIVADHDPLYDEGIEYAERLRAAGNRIELSNYAGMIHGFYNMSGAVDAARQALAESARALKQAFAG
jgi:acetyl esterase